MRVKLLIATDDSDYSEHLSQNLAEHHSDKVSVSVCGTPGRLRELLQTQRFDAALLEPSFASCADLSAITLPLLLAQDDSGQPDIPAGLKAVNRYQRISALVAEVIGHYARVSIGGRSDGDPTARITAVWSPAGGVGKTAVALAYAEKMLLLGKKVMYLNLEPFSSLPAYFGGTGKSISAVFEMLENDEGNIKLLIRSIQQDGGGISYLCRPDNYDDLNVLSPENTEVLVGACAGVTEELVIDMGCTCDERTRKVFELSDRVLLVLGSSSAAQFKLAQFASQHNVYQRIKEKTTTVANMDAAISVRLTSAILFLPMVQSSDPYVVYKTLSAYSFDV